MQPSSKQSRPEAHPILAALPGILVALLSRRVHFVLVAVLASVLFTSLVALSTHRRTAAFDGLHYGDWERSCLEMYGVVLHSKASTNLTVSSPTPPSSTLDAFALSRSLSALAEGVYYPCGAIKLADLLRVYGTPTAAGCAYHLSFKGQPVNRLEVMFAGGRVEAFTMQPGDRRHLLPNALVISLYIYSTEEHVPVKDTVDWRGFASLSAYQGCHTFAQNDIARAQ